MDIRFPWFWFLIACFVLAILTIFWVVVEAEAERRTAFMSECRLDHKQYECDAMWGGMQPKTVYIYTK